MYQPLIFVVCVLLLVLDEFRFCSIQLTKNQKHDKIGV